MNNLPHPEPPLVTLRPCCEEKPAVTAGTYFLSCHSLCNPLTFLIRRRKIVSTKAPQTLSLETEPFFFLQKCDAQTPTCASCARYNRPGDPACSYYTPSISTALSSNEGSSGGPSRTGGRNRVRDLEEEVLRLQKRVKELEEPEDSESVKLFDPYPNRAENSEQGP